MAFLAMEKALASVATSVDAIRNGRFTSTPAVCSARTRALPVDQYDCVGVVTQPRESGLGIVARRVARAAESAPLRASSID